MPWTGEHRRAADRSGLRDPGDMTDAEWALVQPMIRAAKRGHEVLNGRFYVLSAGCQRQAMRKDLPPKSTA